MKSREEIMNMLEAFDLCGSFRDAGELAGCSHHTVAAYVAKRDEGRLPGEGPVRRKRIIDPWMAKIEEWVERSGGRIRAATAQSAEEAHYLCSVLNSVAVTQAVEPFMTSGKGGGRHISSYLWKVPIPLYDTTNELHTTLADLGHRAEQFVSELDIKPSKAHGSMRSKIRKHLAAIELGQEIEAAVETLLA